MRFLLLAAAAMLALAAGCGQTGPLYLRDKPPPVKPVPYPDEPQTENP